MRPPLPDIRHIVLSSLNAFPDASTASSAAAVRLLAAACCCQFIDFILNNGLGYSSNFIVIVASETRIISCARLLLSSHSISNFATYELCLGIDRFSFLPSTIDSCWSFVFSWFQHWEITPKRFAGINFHQLTFLLHKCEFGGRSMLCQLHFHRSKPLEQTTMFLIDAFLIPLDGMEVQTKMRWDSNPHKQFYGSCNWEKFMQFRMISSFSISFIIEWCHCSAVCSGCDLKSWGVISCMPS